MSGLKYDHKLIQSYVRDSYFVSTVLRRSSCEYETLYFETLVSRWDKITRKTGEILDMHDSGVIAEVALANHFKICSRLIGDSDSLTVPTLEECFKEK